MKPYIKAKPKLMALEPRILFDAALGAHAVDKVTTKTTTDKTTTPTNTNTGGSNSSSTPTPVTPPTPTPEPTPTPVTQQELPITEPTTEPENKEPEVSPATPSSPTTEPNTNNNSTTPTTPADGAGKSDEEKNDKNVSGDLGNQGNNETKNDIKGNAGSDGNDNKPNDPPNDDHDDEEDHNDDEEDNDDDEEPPPPPPENQPPDAVDDSVTTDYETPITINVVYNDSDPEIDPITIDSFTQPNYGTVTLVDGKLVYTPPAGYSGTTTFTYTIIDDHGNKDTATVTVTVGGKPNSPPVANNDDYTTDYDTPVTLDLLANDSDPDNDRITIVGMTNPLNGTLSIVNGTLVFTPTTGFSGTTSFTYTIRDERGLESQATVSITIGQAPPEPPAPPPPEPPVEPPAPPPPEPPVEPPAPPPPEPPVEPPVVPPTSPVVPIVIPPRTVIPLMITIPQTISFTPVMAPSMSFPDYFQPSFSVLNSLTISMPQVFTAPLPGVDNGLFVLKPPESVTVGSDRSVDYRLPPDTFASTDSNAKIDVVAQQTNGQALPETIKFDPVTGKISGTLPQGVDVLDITIEATDSNGNKARAQFTIRAGDIRAKVMPGKLPLSEQIRLAVLKMKTGLG